MPAFTTAPTLAGLDRVVHAFSGELTQADDETRLAAAVGAELPRARLRQVHGADVIRAEEAVAAAEAPAGDALLSDRPGVALTIRTADCVPILLVDAEAPVIAAVHAGWRGMRARVVTRALAAMVAAGAEPARIRAAIGPAIQGRCYPVGDEVRAEFEASFPDAAALFDDGRLDLIRAARSELLRGGVAASAVSAVERCTHCESDLASHRRQGPERGNNVALIALV